MVLSKLRSGLMQAKKMKNPVTGEEEVTLPAFENWWKSRLGIEDADIPVLPEYM